MASRLGNTPAVCRSSYIHPAVFEHYASNALIERLARPSLREAEKALLKVLTATSPDGPGSLGHPLARVADVVGDQQGAGA